MNPNPGQCPEIPPTDAMTRVECVSIPGLIGYRVGTDGSLWSCRARGNWAVTGHVFGDRWYQLRGRPHVRDGHIEVHLRDNDGVKRMYKLHQLILTTFVGPCPEGLECRHLNGDPADNRLDNLCWGSRPQNVHDAIAHGTFRPWGKRMRTCLAKPVA